MSLTLNGIATNPFFNAESINFFINEFKDLVSGSGNTSSEGTGNRKTGSWVDEMSPEDAVRYNTWNEQVQAGWSTEERYNFQLFGHPNGVESYKINITTDRSIPRIVNLVQ